MVMTGCSSGDDSKSPPSTSKAITAFYLYGVVGTIDETAKTIDVTMPYGTKRKSLVAMFRTTGKSVTVDSTPQVSEKTPNDFSSPVDYTVTAEDGSSVIYTVTVIETLTPKPRAFTAFSLTGDTGTFDGIINETEKKISVRIPSGTNLTALVATFTTATGATVYVGSTPQESETTENDFTSPVVYTVTAASSSATYTVKINDYVKTHMENDLGGDTIIDSTNYYWYYADGRKAKEQIDSDNNGKIDAVYIYGYDEKWNMTKREFDFNNDGNIDFVDYYTYESDNIITQEFVDLNDSTNDSVYYYRYVNGKKTKAEFDYHNDGTIDSVYYYEYYESGNLKEEKYDDDNNLATTNYIVNYEYDTSGNLTKKMADLNDDGVVDSVSYIYDNGNLTEEKIDLGNNGSPESFITYTYENGNMKTKVSDRGIYTYYWALIEAP